MQMQHYNERNKQGLLKEEWIRECYAVVSCSRHVMD